MGEGRVYMVGIGIESFPIFGAGAVINPSANRARETPLAAGRCPNARIWAVEPQ